MSEAELKDLEGRVYLNTVPGWRIDTDADVTDKQVYALIAEIRRLREPHECINCGQSAG